MRRHERLQLMAPPSPRARAAAIGRNARWTEARAQRDRSGVSRGVRRWGARRASDRGAIPGWTPPRSFLAALLLAAAASLTGCITLPALFEGRTPLTESVVDGTRGPKILLLDLDGLLTESSEAGAFGFGERESTLARLRSELDRAREDPELKAVVLRIQSPGGTVTASDVVYEEIRRFKQRKAIPVVAHLMGVAASGGYYAAMAADAVYAHPTTVTGSIGVLLSGVGFAGLFEKLGLEDQTIKAGERKDTGSPLRRMTAAERAQLQGVLDAMHARFRDVVAESRARAGLTPERVRALADGRIFVASQALDAGLIDGIAYLPDTIEEAKRRAGLTDARVVLYHRSREWSENVYSHGPLGPVRAEGAAPEAPAALPSALRVQLGFGPEPPARGPAFLYLWTGN